MGKHKVYVDNNGTTPLSEEVCALISKTLRSGWANPSSRSDDADVVSLLCYSPDHDLRPAQVLKRKFLRAGNLKLSGYSVM